MDPVSIIDVPIIENSGITEKYNEERTSSVSPGIMFKDFSRLFFNT